MTRSEHSVMLDALRRMFRRDLAALRREVESYPDDVTPWTIVPGIANSGGTLALHIAGNLRHFVGTTLGESDYVRDRDAEFSQRNLPRTFIVSELNAAELAVDRVLREMDASRLDEDFPLRIADMRARIGPFLMHLAVHLAYHLGQVDYHRRIVTGSSETVGTLAMPPVFSGEPLDA